MRAINIITLLLVIVGGLNWGLIGLADIDLVASLAGGRQAMLARVFHVLVGISAVWQLVPFVKALSGDEEAALRVHR
jgi:uncharacterized membrane protein YuzA (DUF378 family)